MAGKLAPSLEHAVAQTSTPPNDEPLEKPH
jgi:hypothetical protein